MLHAEFSRVIASDAEQFYRKLDALIYLTHLSLDAVKSFFFHHAVVNNYTSRYFYLRLFFSLFGRILFYVHVISSDMSPCSQRVLSRLIRLCFLVLALR